MTKKVKSGNVELIFNANTGELEDCVINFPEKDLLIAANAIDTKTLAQALKHVFDGGSKYPSTVYLVQNAQRKGSSWGYLMELADRSERFWLCCGPLSTYIETKQMREIYRDLLEAAEQTGKPDLYGLQELYSVKTGRHSRTSSALTPAKDSSATA